VISDALYQSITYKTFGVFFKPTPRFLTWLGNTVTSWENNPILIEIGCGTGHVLQKLKDTFPQLPTVGVDPFSPTEPSIASPQIVRQPAETFVPKIVQGALTANRDILLLNCRPCHSGFFQDTLTATKALVGTKMPKVLYISKPNNLDRDIDLSLWTASPIPYKGTVGRDYEKGWWITPTT
jgi:hypothetical protein